MVIVTGFATWQNQDGDALWFLSSQEIWTYLTTGRFYASNFSSTFSEEMAATLIGKQLPGKIIKEECDPYDF